MSSPVNSFIQLRYSVGDLIREPADLDMVNQKLLSSGYSYSRIGCVATGKPVIVVPTTEQPSPCMAKVLHEDATVSDNSKTREQMVAASTPSESTLPESLNLMSPDSNLPCESPDCPIKDIPHNIGRYFHNGKQYKKPSASGSEVTIAGTMEEVSNAFNRTVPPPEIVTAYINIRTCADEATRADLNMVREYQKHHMLSPVNSQPSTPWPRDQYPHMHGLHGQLPSGNERYLASDGITSIFDGHLGVWSGHTDDGPVQYKVLSSFSFEQEGQRPLLTTDFEDSDDEDYVPCPPLRAPASDESFTRPFLSSVTAQSDNQFYDGDEEVSDTQDTLYGPRNDSCMGPSTMREVPQGRELMSEKLRLQAIILRGMADDALVQAKKGEELCRPGYTNRDVDLEVLLGLMDALPRALDEGGFRSMLLDKKQDNKGFSDTESWILCDVQIMLQREFQAMITNATRPYAPTGLPVRTAQLREKLNDTMIGRQVVLDASPGESIAEIVGYVFQEDAEWSSK